jgi:hypothetical protein
MVAGMHDLDEEKTQVEQSHKVARLLDVQSATNPGKTSEDALETGQSSGNNSNSTGALTLEAIEGLLDKKFTPMKIQSKKFNRKWVVPKLK